MTPNELVVQLASQQGPCMRFCAYCPENFDTREVKECVEGLISENYSLKQSYDDLLKELINVRRAYKDVTGIEYRDNP